MSLVAYFIKYYTFRNAFGNSGPPIYLVSDVNMDAKVIDVHRVPGFGIGTEFETSSYIVSCKSESANMEFSRWFFMDILVPVVIKSRSVFKLDVSIPAYFCLDGKSDQINPMKNDAVIEAWTLHNIVIGKTPASTTAVTQPNDAGNTFKAARNVNRAIKSPESQSRKKITNNFTLARKLMNVLDDH